MSDTTGTGLPHISVEVVDAPVWAVTIQEPWGRTSVSRFVSDGQAAEYLRMRCDGFFDDHEKCRGFVNDHIERASNQHTGVAQDQMQFDFGDQ